MFASQNFCEKESAMQIASERYGNRLDEVRFSTISFAETAGIRFDQYNLVLLDLF